MVAQWIFFMSCVNHSSVGGLVRSFQGSEGRWKGNIYIKLVEEKEFELLAREEVKFLDFMIIRKCGVALGFLNNQLRVKVDMDFFLS
jgi:hypothetical protein